MNRIAAIATMILLLLISCGEKEKVVEIPVPANCPPSAPAGVYAVNLDGTVLICWWANPEDDIEGYDVYRGTSYYGEYSYLGSVPHTNQSQYCFEDFDTGNGIQHYYAVSAYDKGGLESDLSYEEVTGTPRPEGHVSLNDYLYNPSASGLDLSSLNNTPQAYNAPTTDIFFSGSGDVALIVTYRAGVEIQDYGYTGDFDAINFAPTEGWSPSGSVEAIPDHCYIVKLNESDGFHFAKLFVTSVGSTYVGFWWAYQTDPGNRDLAPAAPGGGSESNTSSSSRNTTSGPMKRTTNLAARSAIPPIVERVTWTRDDESAQRTTE